MQGDEWVWEIAPAVCARGQIKRLKSEVERLQADIQYALDRLSTKADQGPGLRVLIDEATGNGDYFPSYELNRRKEQIHEINSHFAKFQEFNAEVVAEVKRLEHIVRFAGQMLAECEEHKNKCKHTMVNALLRRASEAAEAAKGK